MGIMVLSFAILLFLIVFGGLKLYHSYSHNSSGDIHFLKSMLLVGLILPSFFFKILYPSVILNSYLWVFVGCVLVSMLLEQLKSNKVTLLIQYMLCFCGVSFFSPMIFSVPHFEKILTISLIGWAFWRTFVFFDKFPFVSFVLTMAWSLGFLCSGLIMNTMPMFILFHLLFLSVLLMAINRWRLSQGQLTFGRTLASYAGFLWATLLVYLLYQGNVMSVFSFGVYYVFEGIFLLAALISHHPFETYLNTVLFMTKDRVKPLKIVFFHVLLLTFLTMMLNLYSISVYGVIFLIVIVDLYLKLEALIKPYPSWRKIFKDSKQELKNVIDQMKKKPQKSKKNKGAS